VEALPSGSLQGADGASTVEPIGHAATVAIRAAPHRSRPGGNWRFQGIEVEAVEDAEKPRYKGYIGGKNSDSPSSSASPPTGSTS
jgi:hypothetical protein